MVDDKYDRNTMLHMISLCTAFLSLLPFQLNAIRNGHDVVKHSITFTHCNNLDLPARAAFEVTVYSEYRRVFLFFLLFCFCFRDVASKALLLPP